MVAGNVDARGRDVLAADYAVVGTGSEAVDVLIDFDDEAAKGAAMDGGDGCLNFFEPAVFIRLKDLLA